MTDTNREDIAITARDGYSLGGTLFRPTPQTNLDAAVVIAGATGVSHRYYSKFAKHLAGRGFTVLTFDYRGIGDSAPAKLRGFKAGMHHWGEADLAGAIDWLQDTARPGRLLMVGHSVGGQVLSLADNNRKLDAIILVASQSGHWRLFEQRRLRLFLNWFVLIPVLTRLFGKLPKQLMGGEDLPAGIAREWAKWGRHPDYIVSHGTKVRLGFARITAPLLSYRFTDDQTAPREAVAALLRWYENSAQDDRCIDPKDVGAGSIGHFGFFREKFSDTLWREAGDWLVSRLERDTATEPRQTVTVC